MSGEPDQLAGRLRGFGTSIFGEMTELALRTRAINLGQGFPDTDGPAAMLAAAREAIEAGHNQYPPARGLPALREAVAAARERSYGTLYDPQDEVLITTGATCGIAAAVLGLCNPGDEVIVFDPCYDSYAPCVSMAGGVLCPVRLEVTGNGFGFDPAALRAAVTPRTRIVLLNTPHNPTGKVFTTAELAQIADCCREHDLIAITDEVHEYLVYDGMPMQSLAALPQMRERTVVVSGAGKTFSATGWKVGWACGPAPLVTAVLSAHQFLTFNSGTPFQIAVASALRDHDEWTAYLRGQLQSQRDLLASGLEQAGFTVLRSEGTYFLQVDVRSWGYTDGMTFCYDLPSRAGVVAIPSAVFYRGADPPRNYVRFAFCKRPEILRRAVAALQAACGVAEPARYPAAPTMSP